MGVRSPLRFVYGNCVFATGLDDGWAAFALSTASYECLPEEEKHARFQALTSVLETAQADVQILRVNRGWDERRYVRGLCGRNLDSAPVERDLNGAPRDLDGAAGVQYARVRAMWVSRLGVCVRSARPGRRCSCL